MVTAARPRTSPPSAADARVLSFDEALALLEQTVASLGSEEVALVHAAGRTLAEDVVARIDAPRSDVAIMDGYAVRLSDVGERPLRVDGEVRPGIPLGKPLGGGEAARIFTGAPIPQGADRVIMQEYAEIDGDAITFAEGHGPGNHIRPRASDFARGNTLLTAGTRLTPQALLAAAAADCSTLEVGRNPRLSIIATGDELTAAGEAHATAGGAIPDSASVGVAALAQRYGARIVRAVRAADDLATLSDLASQALDEADVVVVIGGASVGRHDLAKPMFESSSLKLVFSKLAIKPGRPVWLGQAQGTPVLGLPGNPTSALVCARLFLAPLLGLMQGAPLMRDLTFIALPTADGLPENGPRETFLRAQVTPNGLSLSDNRYSGAQAALSQADWLIRRAPNASARKSGTSVPALPL